MSAKNLALLIVLVTVAAAGLPAADLHLNTALDAMASLHTVYIVPAVSFTWQPGLTGIGVELKLPVSLSRGDTYLAALVLFKVGWLDFGTGISTQVVPPSRGEPALDYPSSPVLFTGRIGLTAPILTIGPGKLGLNATADFLITAANISEVIAPTNIAEVIVYPVVWILAETANALKFSVGVNYTLDL